MRTPKVKILEICVIQVSRSKTKLTQCGIINSDISEGPAAWTRTPGATAKFLLW